MLFSAINWQDWLPFQCILCKTLSCTAICVDCQHHFRLFPTHCLKCSRSQLDKGNICGRCLRENPYIDGLEIVYCFESGIRELVLAAKFAANRAALSFMGNQLLGLTLPDVDVVIPMPISLPRLAKRGFNQTHYLAADIARHKKVVLNKTLLTKSARPPQSRLPAKQRMKNMRGAFSTKQRIRGSVLLIDDVYTTGTTLREAARVLKVAGAEQVFAAVFAATFYDD